MLRLEPYVAQLEKTCGLISEFVNPKYRDASRTAFKSATRLECMMQDYPKELPSDARIGFTVINQVARGQRFLITVTDSIAQSSSRTGHHVGYSFYVHGSGDTISVDVLDEEVPQQLFSAL